MDVLACLLRSRLSTSTTFDPASISHFQSYPNQTVLFYFKSELFFVPKREVVHVLQEDCLFSGLSLQI